MTKKRQSNDPRRRIAPLTNNSPAMLAGLIERLGYVGSAIHKTKPADYGFHPPTNPGPNKSICDGVRIILRHEAQDLFQEGLRRGMISTHQDADGCPKFVWAVDDHGIVYEAKPGNGGYHGYVLDQSADPHMCTLVQNEWKARS